MENQLDGQQAELISAFHAIWGAFPGMARLINQKHEILASNGSAQKKGFEPGAICAQVPSPQAHKGCLLTKAIQTGQAQFDQPNEHLFRGWVPVWGHDGIVVHFSIRTL